MSATSTLKEQAIRDAEQLVDKRRAKFDELMEEAAQVEEEIAEARGWLHFLKTGKDSPVRAAPTIPKAKRPAGVTVPDVEFMEALRSFGDEEFTVAELAERTGQSKERTRQRLAVLPESAVVIVEKSALVPGEGRTSTLYRSS